MFSAKKDRSKNESAAEALKGVWREQSRQDKILGIVGIVILLFGVARAAMWLWDTVAGDSASAPSTSDWSVWPWLLVAAVLSAVLIAVGSSLQRAGQIVIFKSYGEASLAIFLTVGVPLLGVVIWFLGTWFNAFKVVEASLAVPFFMGCAALLAAGTLLVNSVRSNRSLGTGLLSFAVKVAFGVVGLLVMLVSLAFHQAPTRRDDETKQQFDDRVSAAKAKAVVADAFMIGALALLGLAVVSDGEADAGNVDSPQASVDQHRVLLARVGRQLEKINETFDSSAKITELVKSPPALVSAMLTQVAECSAVIEEVRQAHVDGGKASPESAATLRAATQLAEGAAKSASILNRIKAMQAR